VATAGLLGGLFDAEAAQRGYLLTGENDYYARYLLARAGVESSVQRLADLTPEDAAQKRRLAQIDPLIKARIPKIDDTFNLYRNGDPQGAIDIVRSGQGMLLMADIRTIIMDMDRAERRVLEAREAGVDRALSYQAIAILLTLFCAMLLIGVSLRSRLA